MKLGLIVLSTVSLIQFSACGRAISSNPVEVKSPLASESSGSKPNPADHPSESATLASSLTGGSLASLAPSTAELPRPEGSLNHDPYSLDVSRHEAREALNGILDEIRINEARGVSPTAETISFAHRLVRAYRRTGGSIPVAIKDAPYPDFLVATKMSEIYPQLFDSEYTKQYKANVEALPPEFMLDVLMEAIIQDKIPAGIPELKAAADQIGHCLAKRVKAGKSESCKLDNSENRIKDEDMPGFFTQAAAKLLCPIHFPVPTKCRVRKTVFALAKNQLLDFRKDPKVKEIIATGFNEAYPSAFREEFLKQLPEYRTRWIEDILSKKFGSEPDELWDSETPLVETEKGGKGAISLEEVASGIRADIGAAALFIRSADPKEKAMAGPLLYAAANKFLALTGGPKAAWNGERFRLDPSDQFDAKAPKKPPVIVSEAFGGWGLEKGQNGPAFSAWDWKNYDPTRADHPSAFRIFPSLFDIAQDLLPDFRSHRLLADALGARMAPVHEEPEPFESLSDLGDLLSASSMFLKLTQQGQPLSNYFGDAANAGDIVDPTKPMAFPREGRLLVYGVIAGIFRNVTADKLGHVQESPADGKLIFFDRVGLEGRASAPVSVSGVAKTLLGVAELREFLPKDPDAPAELKAMVPKLDDALTIGDIVLNAKAQALDGGYSEALDQPMSSGRSLSTAALAMLATTRVYDLSQALVYRLSVHLGWQFLERFWEGERTIPYAQEGKVARALSPSELWALLRLWSDTQLHVRPDLEKEPPNNVKIDWKKWEKRFADLHGLVDEQLRGRNGPAPLEQ